MANTAPLNLLGLDHETIKAGIRSFLASANSPFKDYDFEGSNMSVFIDMLAYNTGLNAFFTNMVASEAFLDSAQLRSSIVSHAKKLNYLPRSAASATASVRLTFEADSEEVIVLEKGKSFSTTIRGESFVFTLPDYVTLTSSNGSFSGDLTIYEGIFLSDAYTMRPEQNMVINNGNADVSSVTVSVLENGSDDAIVYTRAQSLLGLDEFSRVYFLQMYDDTRYEVVFGNGLLGKKPADGSIVTVEYRITRGNEGNGARAFTINFTPGGVGTGIENLNVETLSPSTGGSAAEDDESVRFYAPRHFSIQERAVTTQDYELLLRMNYPEINTVTAYGGEELEPPRHGKVYIAVDITGVDGIPDTKKVEYYKFLKVRSPLGIDPIFVDPDFTYFSLSSTVHLNVNTTTLSKENVKSLVIDAITAYNDTYLNDFKSTLRYSKLCEAIDSVLDSVVGNQTSLRVYKRLSPRPGVSYSPTIDFALELDSTLSRKGGSYSERERVAVRSQDFTYNGEGIRFEDDGNGIIRLVRVVNGTVSVIRDVGTVDYSIGRINLTNFQVDAFTGPYLKVYACPADLDVSTGKNTILTTEADEIMVDVVEVRE